MHGTDSGTRARVEAIFARAGFVQALGIVLVDTGAGWCETTLEVEARHLQQDQFVHAGVVATIADHTAGAAASTTLPEGKAVLTAEYKINLLRPGVAERLRCRASVLKPGKQLTVVESEVWGETAGKSKLLAKALLTMAIV